MHEITAHTVFVSMDGGYLDVISTEGELLFQIAVPAGRVRASQYLDLVPEGARLEVSVGVYAFQPPARVGGKGGVMDFGEGSHDSGANPDFVPTNATRLELETRQRLAHLTKLGTTLERRMKALDAVERIPEAPVKVVEDGLPPLPEKPLKAKKAAAQVDDE